MWTNAKGEDSSSFCYGQFLERSLQSKCGLKKETKAMATILQTTLQINTIFGCLWKLWNYSFINTLRSWDIIHLKYK